MDFNPATLARLLLLVVTIGAFLGALGLQVSATLDLRRYAPGESGRNNTYQYIIRDYAFEPPVPRALRLRYLLSLVLASLSFGGMFVLALMAPNYQMATMLGLVFLVGMWVSLSSWKRYVRHRNK